VPKMIPLMACLLHHTHFRLASTHEMHALFDHGEGVCF
jgi:hypothetical protein